MFVKNITFLFLAVVLLSNVSIVKAQEITPSVIPSPTPVAYTLPYPGLLPGHPLYGLKSFRDAVMGFFISNPVKKAEYELAEADKGLQATLLLIERKKDEKLILASLIKSESDFERAVTQAKEAKQQGIDIAEFLATLTLANKKHQEVVSVISKSTQGAVKQEAVKQLEKTKEIEKTLRF